MVRSSCTLFWRQVDQAGEAIFRTQPNRWDPEAVRIDEVRSSVGRRKDSNWALHGERRERAIGIDDRRRFDPTDSALVAVKGRGEVQEGVSDVDWFRPGPGRPPGSGRIPV